MKRARADRRVETLSINETFSGVVSVVSSEELKPERKMARRGNSKENTEGGNRSSSPRSQREGGGRSSPREGGATRVASPREGGATRVASPRQEDSTRLSPRNSGSPRINVTNQRAQSPRGAQGGDRSGSQSSPRTSAAEIIANDERQDRGRSQSRSKRPIDVDANDVVNSNDLSVLNGVSPNVSKERTEEKNLIQNQKTKNLMNLTALNDEFAESFQDPLYQRFHGEGKLFPDTPGRGGKTTNDSSGESFLSGSVNDGVNGSSGIAANAKGKSTGSTSNGVNGVVKLHEDMIIDGPFQTAFVADGDSIPIEGMMVHDLDVQSLTKAVNINPLAEEREISRKPSAEGVDNTTNTNSNSSAKETKEETKEEAPKVVPKVVEEAAICCICLDEPPDLAHTLPCGHCNMCGECAMQLVSKLYARCPYCRTPFRKKTEQDTKNYTERQNTPQSGHGIPNEATQSNSPLLTIAGSANSSPVATENRGNSNSNSSSRSNSAGSNYHGPLGTGALGPGGSILPRTPRSGKDGKHHYNFETSNYVEVSLEELARVDAATSIQALGVVRASDLDLYRDLRATFVRYRQFQQQVRQRSASPSPAAAFIRRTRSQQTGNTGNDEAQEDPPQEGSSLGRRIASNDRGEWISEVANQTRANANNANRGGGSMNPLNALTRNSNNQGSTGNTNRVGQGIPGGSTGGIQGPQSSPYQNSRDHSIEQTMEVAANTMQAANQNNPQMPSLLQNGLRMGSHSSSSSSSSSMQNSQNCQNRGNTPHGQITGQQGLPQFLNLNQFENVSSASSASSSSFLKNVPIIGSLLGNKKKKHNKRSISSDWGAPLLRRGRSRSMQQALPSNSGTTGGSSSSSTVHSTLPMVTNNDSNSASSNSNAVAWGNQDCRSPSNAANTSAAGTSRKREGKNSLEDGATASIGTPTSTGTTTIGTSVGNSTASAGKSIPFITNNAGKKNAKATTNHYRVSNSLQVEDGSNSSSSSSSSKNPSSIKKQSSSDSHVTCESGVGSSTVDLGKISIASDVGHSRSGASGTKGSESLPVLGGEEFALLGSDANMGNEAIIGSLRIENSGSSLPSSVFASPNVSPSGQSSGSVMNSLANGNSTNGKHTEMVNMNSSNADNTPMLANFLGMKSPPLSSTSSSTNSQFPGLPTSSGISTNLVSHSDRSSVGNANTTGTPVLSLNSNSHSNLPPVNSTLPQLAAHGTCNGSCTFLPPICDGRGVASSSSASGTSDSGEINGTQVVGQPVTGLLNSNGTSITFHGSPMTNPIGLPIVTMPGHPAISNENISTSVGVASPANMAGTSPTTIGTGTSPATTVGSPATATGTSPAQSPVGEAAGDQALEQELQELLELLRRNPDLMRENPGLMSEEEMEILRTQQIERRILDTNHILCPCGTHMVRIAARSAYASSLGCPIECDLCNRAMRGRTYVYHCPSERTGVHPFGFDLCCRCATSNPEADEISDHTDSFGNRLQTNPFTHGTSVVERMVCLPALQTARNGITSMIRNIRGRLSNAMQIAEDRMSMSSSSSSSGGPNNRSGSGGNTAQRRSISGGNSAQRRTISGGNRYALGNHRGNGNQNANQSGFSVTQRESSHSASVGSSSGESSAANSASNSAGEDNDDYHDDDDHDETIIMRDVEIITSSSRPLASGGFPSPNAFGNNRNRRSRGFFHPLRITGGSASTAFSRRRNGGTSGQVNVHRNRNSNFATSLSLPFSTSFGVFGNSGNSNPSNHGNGNVDESSADTNNGRNSVPISTNQLTLNLHSTDIIDWDEAYSGRDQAPRHSDHAVSRPVLDQMLFGIGGQWEAVD